MAKTKDIFFTGMRILLNVVEKNYQGTIMEFSEGESIMVRLSNPDMTLVHIMPDTECKVKFIDDNGIAYNISTILLKRKIPNIIIKYPDKFEGVSIRKYQRISTSYWAAILNEVNENGVVSLKPSGDGTIVDMSLGGCKLMTVLQYKIGSQIWLSFNYGDGDNQLTFKGIVRNMKHAPYDTMYYGIEFDSPARDFIKIIEEILKKPTA